MILYGNAADRGEPQRENMLRFTAKTRCTALLKPFNRGAQSRRKHDMWKRMLAAAAVASLAAALPATGWAEDNYPSQTITFIVPYGPGGTVDPTARILGAAAGKILGQKIIVENQPGAAGSIGTEAAVRAPADGYTVLIHTNLVASEPWLKHDLPYDFAKSMTPVVAIDETPFVVLLNPSVPVNSVKELVDYAKQHPGELNYGASGVGSSGHLRGEQFKQATGTDMVFVPYVDGGSTLAALVSGEIQVAFDTLPGSIGMIRDGKLKLLAVSTPERWFLVPDTPTMAEAGFPGMVSQWIGAYVRSETPPAIIDKLASAFQQALKTPEVQEQYKTIGFKTIGTGPEETAAALKAETASWKKTIETAGITIK
jgi:tripartite-type tricarboxylate transporter receptor subunit TctC